MAQCESGSMLDAGTVIVAFTKDWDDVPTCTTHILREMGRRIPVLWVGSIGTRRPSAGSLKDWRRIWRRIWRGLRPAAHKEHFLYVLYPLLIPKAKSRWACRLNRTLLRWYVRRFMHTVAGGGGEHTRERAAADDLREAGHGVIEYWCFVPNAVDLLPETAKGNAARIIYYVADDWAAFHNLDGAWMGQKERALVHRADVIFATSPFLVDKLERMCLADRDESGKRVVLIPHGVDYDLFSAALDQAALIPAEIRDLPRPIIGFYGNLHPWVDFALIEKMARARPGWSFVLIGENYAAPGSLGDCPHVYLLGRREHARLPDYCRGFDVAMIPYDMDDGRMESVNPVKTKELLAAGVPVVAAAVPVLSGYGEDVLVCRSLDDWLAALERQAGRSREERVAMSGRMQGESWDRKVEQIREIVASL